MLENRQYGTVIPERRKTEKACNHTSSLLALSRLYHKEKPHNASSLTEPEVEIRVNEVAVI